MRSILSERAEAGKAVLDIPWRFAPSTTYDPVTNKSGLIAFSTAENKLVTEDVFNFVRDNAQLESRHLRYATLDVDVARFSRALANHLNEYMRPYESITADSIRVTSAATAMHDILAWGLADPGDAFLVSRPIYGRFEIDFGNKSQVKLVYADTNAETCFNVDVVEQFEKALKHRVHLISDEIYACSVFDSGEPDAVPYTPILSIDSSEFIEPEFLHVTYGLSKDFGSPGLSLGGIVTRSRPLLRAIDAVKRFHEVSGPSLAMGNAILENGPWRHGFIEATRKKLAEAYKHVTQGLNELGINYLRGTNAGFFLYIDLSPYLPSDLAGESNAEFALARSLLDAGVFLHPREEHASKPGWFRLVYTQPAGTVTEGLKRMQSVIEKSR
ncbi:hypothetical protein S40285_01382 [Stachybotrys chlorohalonatus IBT 40285]|uniref:Aminotransferase class I/classII large domain-containing protein n=1 Tax=Stachybotrys chlorohalonatus (strain IBT 40285) TaxID=1283841 RepID=A0A084QLD6_STAC4|nr:hypothetical protein S40285_01382 [Stachybotrys chlorohalonata IBT 40285]